MLLLDTFLFTWIDMTLETDTHALNKITVGPMFVAVNRHWYFIGELMQCEASIFSKDFCSDHSVDILIATSVYLVGALITITVYIASLIAPNHNIDRFNWLGLLATLLAWSIVILINSYFTDLSIGFYIMVIVVGVSTP
jgi:hypothetical protein